MLITILIQENTIPVFLELQEISSACFGYGVRKEIRTQSRKRFQGIDLILG
jgi:hypothetical protein